MLTRAFASSETPDRVPIFAQLHEFACHRFDLLPSDFYRDPELLVQAQLYACVDFGIDVAYVDADIYNIEAEGIGQVIVFDDDKVPDIEKLDPEFYVEYAALHDVQIGMRHDRFALSLCNLGPTTPEPNVRAAVAALNHYGQYR